MSKKENETKKLSENQNGSKIERKDGRMDAGKMNRWTKGDNRNKFTTKKTKKKPREIYQKRNHINTRATC